MCQCKQIVTELSQRDSRPWPFATGTLESKKGVPQNGACKNVLFLEEGTILRTPYISPIQNTDDRMPGTFVTKKVTANVAQVIAGPFLTAIGLDR